MLVYSSRVVCSLVSRPLLLLVKGEVEHHSHVRFDLFLEASLHSQYCSICSIMVRMGTLKNDVIRHSERSVVSILCMLSLLGDRLLDV